MVGSLKEHLETLPREDAEMLEEIDRDVKGARLVAQNNFGQGADRDRSLGTLIFEEISARRKEDD